MNFFLLMLALVESSVGTGTFLTARGFGAALGFAGALGFLATVFFGGALGGIYHGLTFSN